MTEKVKESISALVDEEISEIEVHRLLRQYSDEDELRTTFVSYQQIRAIIKQENYLSHAQHVVLHSNILAAIELEEAPVLSSEMASASASRSVQNRASRKTLMMFPERMKLPAAGFAVAASIVVAVFVGFNVVDNPANVASQDSAGVLATQSATNTSLAASSTPLRQTTASTQLDARRTGPLDAQSVSNQVAMQAGAGSDLQSELIEDNDSLGELRELDPDKQRQLRQYLNQHDRNIRMNPYARTVDYKQPKQK